MSSDTEERINFASAKSLFEKDSKTSSTNSHPTSKSTNVNIQRSLEDVGQKTEKQESSSGEQKPEGNVSPVRSGVTFRLPSLTSSDDFVDVPKTKFIIPNKRGDTSDLKWLTTVHNSIAIGGGSRVERQKSLTTKSSAEVDGLKNNEVPLTNSNANRSFVAGKSIPKSSSSNSISSIGPQSLATFLVSNKTKDDLNVPISNSNNVTATNVSMKKVIENNGNSFRYNEDVTDNTSVVKTSMTVTLNSNVGRGVGVGGQKNVSKDWKKSEISTKESAPLSRPAAVSATVVVAEEKPNQDRLMNQAEQSATKVTMTTTTTTTNGIKEMSEKYSNFGSFEQQDDGNRRTKLVNWDPTKLMKELYQITLQPDVDEMSDYINMEGYLEKLPISKSKDTFLKTWKRRYFKAHNGSLHYYESNGENKESGSFKLNGGMVEEIGERMFGIEDGRGHYLILRSASDKDCFEWKRALTSQTTEGIPSTWIKPVLKSLRPSEKKVVLLELGSCSIRAGILGDVPALPEVFLPTVVATHNANGQKRYGFDALLPDVRSTSVVSYPVRPTGKVEKYSIDWDSLQGLFDHVFHLLNVNPSRYSIMLSIPTNLNDKMKSKLMDMFVNRFNVPAVNMVCQAILSLYSYNASTGIVVDIGDRIEILPVADGYVVEGGVNRFPYGGQTMTDALNRTFSERQYRFQTDIEFQIVRLAMEKLCYVSKDFTSDMTRCSEHADDFTSHLLFDRYNLPDGNNREISCDVGRFKSPEGLFDTYFWDLENPSLHEMIQKAISSCPIDNRKQMWRSIYLSGGVTQLSGFVERLQLELTKLAPSSVVVQIHAAPNRYHSSYLGTSVVASMQAFDVGCITASQWRSNGEAVLKKWKAY